MDRIHDILNSVNETLSGLPKATKDKPGIKTAKAAVPFNLGDKVVNINSSCMHYGSKGKDDEDEDSVIMSSDDIESGEEMNGYKQSYYDMSVGSLRAIMNHAKNILNYLDNPMVKENLTAPHLQGMIAVAEDHLRSIHDFVMFVETDDDDYEETESVTMGQNNRPGLWENIRKKKEREGKKYRPAKPGDKDRPDPDMWKKLTK